MMRRKLFTLILLAIVFTFYWVDYGITQEVVPEKQKQETQVEKKTEKIIPSSKNIKEKTGIYVFLGWMWLSIFVLIYILRQKIKEVDRLFLLKFFSSEKK